MGLFMVMEIVLFVLFFLLVGVWFDWVCKLLVYVIGEFLLGVIVVSVFLVWWMGWFLMIWLYVVGFVIGMVYIVVGLVV